MALLSATYTNLVDAIKDATGLTALAAADYTQIVNEALEMVTVAHNWTWRDTTSQITYVISTVTYDLPANFGELIAVVPSASKRPVVLKSLGELMAIRADGRDDGFTYVAISAKAQSSATAVPLRQLEVHPSPAALSNALMIAYKKLSPTLSGSGATDIPEVPSGLHSLLLQAARMKALSMFEPSGEELAPQLAKYQAMLSAAIREDTKASGTVPEAVA